MSPFLAEVQVINVGGKSADSEATATPTEESVHALAMQVKAKALAQAAAGLKQAKDSLDAQAATEAHEEQPDSTPKHHSRSSGSDDVPFAIIPIVAITFTFLWLIVRALMAPFTNRGRRSAQVPPAAGLSEEEAAILEKLQRTLIQMESRVESLETILIDASRTKEKYGTKL